MKPPRFTLIVFTVAISMTLAGLVGCPKDNANKSGAAKAQTTPTITSQASNQASNQQASQQTPLPAPTLLAPEKDAALHGYPRTLNFQWTPVPGADNYGLEVDCYGCGAAHMFSSDAGKPTVIMRGLRQTAYSYDFVGDQPGRWRVWAHSNASGDGAIPSWSDRARMKWSMGLCGQPLSFTGGRSGRSGFRNAQWPDHLAPWSIQSLTRASSCGLSGSSSLGGMVGFFVRPAS